MLAIMHRGVQIAYFLSRNLPAKQNDRVLVNVVTELKTPWS
jgi:hypothetical protein